jgi:phosphatidyl-myo-inositol dimannoside synthase
VQGSNNAGRSPSNKADAGMSSTTVEPADSLMQPRTPPASRGGRRIVYAMTGADGLCGGIATANKNVLRALSRLAQDGGCRFTVLSLHETVKDRPDCLPQDAEFLAFGGRKLPFAARLAQRACAGGLLAFDHVTLSPPVLPHSVLRRCRLAILAHGSEADDRMKRSSRWMFRLADKVLTNSDLTRERLLRWLPDVQAETCWLGLSPDFDLPDALPESASPTVELTACDGVRRRIGERMLLLVARMDASEGEKGHDAVIRALPRLRTKFPDVQAVFPGSGSGREALARMAADLNVADAVFLPGFVTTPALQAYYRQCAAYVMPSQQEGFGLVYLEAMSAGKPCVGCRNDGAEEVIVHDETGLLIADQSDTSELVAALDRLLAAPDWSAQLGRRGFQRLHEHFTAARHQQRVLTALRPLMETGSR